MFFMGQMLRQQLYGKRKDCEEVLPHKHVFVWSPIRKGISCWQAFSADNRTIQNFVSALAVAYDRGKQGK